MFHVVVNGATFLNSGNNGGEVIVGEDHVGGRLGDSSTRTHGNTDFGLKWDFKKWSKKWLLKNPEMGTFLRAGASLTPSPVIAVTSPFF